MAAPDSSSKMNAISAASVDSVDDSFRRNTDSLDTVDEANKSTGQLGKGFSRIAIDRDEYLLAYRELIYDKNTLQVKNNILHRRLADFYKKRKMEHVLKPLENSADLEEKYEQLLMAYEQLKEMEEREVADIKAKLLTVQVHYEKQLKYAEKKFQGLQDYERNTGSGLIYSKKGKPISDKTVARLINLQKDKARRASAMMLRYIRVRNAVTEQENIIISLEKIAPGLFVARYEQLRVDNLNYVNKIEERDDELIKNRNSCTEHNQILAHIREKMNHTEEVIDSTECDLGDAEIICQRAREKLGEVKTRRDQLRIAQEKERLKAAMLARKDLLYDFQDADELLVKLRDKKRYLERQIAKTNIELRQCRNTLIKENHKPENQGGIIFKDDFHLMD